MLACQLRSTACATGVNPDPEVETTAGELFALLTNETEPVELPGAGGAKLMVAVVLAPAATDLGKVIPLTLYPLPVTFAADMLTVALPVLVRVTDLLELPPTATCPKDQVVGDTLNNGLGGAVAEPESVTGEI
jgi:hypothetical protein